MIPMSQYTTPITTAFQMQRATIEQSQQAFQQSVEFNKRMSEAFVDSLDSQESAQRRTVELSQSAMHTYLDAVESMLPSTGATVDEMRSALDEQFDFLLENHAEVFDNIETESSEAIETFDDVTADYLAAVDEQIEMLLEAHEEIETQSVDAAEELRDQLEGVQDQVSEMQQQVQAVQEQAAESIDIEG